MSLACVCLLFACGGGGDDGLEDAAIDAPPDAPALDDGGIDADASPSDADGGDGGDGGPTPAMVMPSATTLDFGGVLAPASQQAEVTLRNAGGTPSGLLTVDIAGDDALSLAHDGCSGRSLGPEASCVLTIALVTDAPAHLSATLAVTEADGVTFMIGITAEVTVVPSIVLDVAAHDFGVVPVDTTHTITVRATNAGSAMQHALATALVGDDVYARVDDGCEGVTLDADAHCEITLAYAPDRVGASEAALSVAIAPGVDVETALFGRAVEGTSLGVSRGSIDFGRRLVGAFSERVPVVVTNHGLGTTGALVVARAGSHAQHFDLIANGCADQVLAPGASCTYDVAFTPDAHGVFEAGTTITDPLGGVATVTLAGIGYRSALLASASGGRDFGHVDVGEVSAEHVIVLENHGDEDARRIGTSWVGDASPFAITASTCGLVLAPGATCELRVRFVPARPGPFAATLTIAGQPGGARTFAFSGIGITTTKRTVTVHIDGLEGHGDVRSTSVPLPDQELDCGTTCSLSFMHGSVVTLRAKPIPGAFFGRFEGACTSDLPTCALAVGGDSEVRASFTPANRVFTTQATYTLAELKAHATDASSEAARAQSGADAICRAIGGDRNFFAYMGSVDAPAAARLPEGTRGFVRADGAPAFTQPDPRAPAYYPPLLDIDGVPVPAPAEVWSGVDASGGSYYYNTCSNWAGTGSHNVGDVRHVRWAFRTAQTCAPDTRLHVLCLETRYGADVAPQPPPTDARRLFTSSSIYIPNSRVGLAGADARCMNDAAAAGLTGTFRALLATSTASPMARVGSRVAPIYRADGVRVADSLAALVAGAPAAPLGIEARGTRTVTSAIWTGATALDATGAVADVCHDETRGDWMSSHTAAGRRGDGWSLSDWLDVETGSCGLSGRVYCLED